jgi:Transglutaminase-like superfamily
MEITNKSDIPNFIGKTMDRVQFASNSDIIKMIEKAFAGSVTQTKKIAKNFKGKNDFESCKNIWNWLKSNIEYDKDNDDEQIIKYPSSLMNSGSGDCKSLALFSAAILKNLNIPFVFRYVNQTGGTIPRHVYVCAYNNDGSEIIIDTVYTKFNAEPPGIQYKKDYNYNTKNKNSVSGVNFNNKENIEFTDYLDEKVNELSSIGLISTSTGVVACASAVGLDAATAGLVAAFVATGGTANAYWLTPLGIAHAAKLAAANVECALYLNQFSPFGPPAVSIKPDTLFELDHKNSSNLYEKVFYNFEPYNQKDYPNPGIARQEISNAYAFDHMVDPTLKGIWDAGMGGSRDDAYTKYTYFCTSVYNKIGKDSPAFWAAVDIKYNNNRFAAYADATKIGWDDWYAKFGVITPEQLIKNANKNKKKMGNFDFVGKNNFNGIDVPGFHSPEMHGLNVGDMVTIASNNPSYNGTFKVLLGSADDGTYLGTIFLADMPFAGSGSGTWQQVAPTTQATASASGGINYYLWGGLAVAALGILYFLKRK